MAVLGISVVYRSVLLTIEFQDFPVQLDDVEDTRRQSLNVADRITLAAVRPPVSYRRGYASASMGPLCLCWSRFGRALLPPTIASCVTCPAAT